MLKCRSFPYSLGGLILDFAVGNYTGIAVFQPVINGLYYSSILCLFKIHFPLEYTMCQ